VIQVRTIVIDPDQPDRVTFTTREGEIVFALAPAGGPNGEGGVAMLAGGVAHGISAPAVKVLAEWLYGCAVSLGQVTA